MAACSSKPAGENYCFAFYESYGLPVSVVRYSNVFGPYQTPENPYCGVVSKFLIAVYAGRPIAIHGDGGQTRDFTFVDDAVGATLLAAIHPRAEGEVFNVGTGIETSVNDLADAIRAADGVLIVTPEYNWSIPGVLKNAIDWVSRLEEQPFKDKPVAIQSASQGPLGGARMQYHLRMALTFSDALLFGRPEIFVGLAATKFDKDTLELKDQPTKDVIKMQIAAFAKFIAKMKK